MTGEEFLKVIKFGRRITYTMIILVVVAGLFWGVWQYTNRAQSHQFQGQVLKFSNDELELSGTYVLDDNPNMSDFANLRNIRVKIDPNTKFARTVLYMPTQKELNESGGLWDPAKLRQEQQTGSLVDFEKTEGMGVTVKTLENSMGDSVILASEIAYTTQVYPEEPLKRTP